MQENNSVSTGETQNMMPARKVNPFIQLLKAFCYFLLFLGLQLGVTFVGAILYGIIAALKLAQEGKALSPNDSTALMLKFVTDCTYPVLIVYAVLLLLFLWLFFVIRKKKVLQETFAVSFQPRFIPAILLLSVGFAFFFNTALNLLPEAWLADYAESSSFVGKGPLFLSLLGGAICAPIAEEVIFRGLIYSRLKKAFPTAVAIALSSLLFGLVHGQVLWTAYTFILGSCLCLVAEKTGSILPTILIHILFNAFGIGLEHIGAGYTIGLFYTMLLSGILFIILGFILLYRKRPEETAAE